MKTIPIHSLNANENKSVCGQCGGECCKVMPGIYHPDDLFNGMSDAQIKEKIISMLKAGETVMIDNEVDGKRVIALTPRVAGRGNVWHAYAGFNYGTCIHLSDSGCKLSSEDRPAECRALVPDENKRCKPEPSFNRDGLLQEWLIYENIMEDVQDYHRENIALKL